MLLRWNPANEADVVINNRSLCMFLILTNRYSGHVLIRLGRLEIHDIAKHNPLPTSHNKPHSRCSSYITVTL